jgi:hypothetical protein
LNVYNRSFQLTRCCCCYNPDVRTHSHNTNTTAAIHQGLFQPSSLPRKGAEVTSKLDRACTEFKLHAVYIKRIPPSEESNFFFSFLATTRGMVDMRAIQSLRLDMAYYHAKSYHIFAYIDIFHNIMIQKCRERGVG